MKHIVRDNPAWRRVWCDAKAANPTSQIHTSAKTAEEHQRNFRTWRKEHPTTAVALSAYTVASLDRNFQILASEL